MSKITRNAGNLTAFASAEHQDERTVFGSTDNTQSNDLTAQFTAEFARGWGIVGANGNPTKQDFNALGFTVTQVLAYLQQMGVSEWDNAQEYYTGAVVIHDGLLWQAMTDNPTDEPTDQTAEWLAMIRSDDGKLALVSQPVAEAGADTEVRGWSAQRVRQALDAVVKDIPVAILEKKYSNKLPAIKKTAWDTVVIRAGTSVSVNGKVVSFDTDTPCGLLAPETYVGAIDYAVIVQEDGTVYSTRDSYATPASVPADGMKLGGYHFGRTDENEAPSGNKTEADMVMLRGIRELSIWDLRICPVNSGAKDNRGKTRTRQGDVWFDIYLTDKEYAFRGFSSPFTLSETGDSKIAGGALTNGREYPLIPTDFGGDGTVAYGSTTWWEINEVLSAGGMQMPRYREFALAAYGVQENATMDSLGKTYNTGVQAYVKELMSADGLEHVTGSQYQWTDDPMMGRTVSGSGQEKQVTDGRGSIYAIGTENNPTALLFGRYATRTPAYVGSRSVVTGIWLWTVYWDLGGRGRCDCTYL